MRKERRQRSRSGCEGNCGWRRLVHASIVWGMYFGTAGTCLEMVVVPGGENMMGSG